MDEARRVEDHIREIIDWRYGSIPKFADKIGLPPSTIYTALRKGLASAQANTVMPIVAELGIDPNWLVKNQLVEVSDDRDFVDVPVYGSIAAGVPLEMIPIDKTHPIPAELARKYPEAFLLKVNGESMNRILPNGVYSLINPCREVEINEKPYALCVNGFEATIKRVKLLNNGYELIPDSTDPTFKSVIYDYGVPGTELITIIGRVVWYTLPFDWGF